MMLTAVCAHTLGQYDSTRIQGQKDLIDIGKKVFHLHAKPGTGPPSNIQFSFLPVSNQAAGPQGLTITATTATFRLVNDAPGNLSTVTFAPYVALHGRFGFTFRSNLWMPANRWYLMGDDRLLYYPQDTWGLGGATSAGTRLRVYYKYLRLYETVFKRLRPSLFAGAGLLVDNRYDLDSPGDSTVLQIFTHYPYGTGATEQSTSVGFSVNLLYDTRRNTEDPLPGCYVHLAYRFNPAWAGTSNPWRSLYAEMRKYLPFSHIRQDMLAIWTFYWSALNSHAPYFDLPSIGWDPYQQRSGRGFPQNRYRGNSLLDFELEYRRGITSDGLLGFVLFANANSVTDAAAGRFTYLHSAVGAGLRIKFNKRSGSNISLDFGHSRSFTGIYLNLGETF